MINSAPGGQFKDWRPCPVRDVEVGRLKEDGPCLYTGARAVWTGLPLSGVIGHGPSLSRWWEAGSKPLLLTGDALGKPRGAPRRLGSQDGPQPRQRRSISRPEVGGRAPGHCSRLWRPGWVSTSSPEATCLPCFATTEAAREGSGEARAKRRGSRRGRADLRLLGTARRVARHGGSKVDEAEGERRSAYKRPPTSLLGKAVTRRVIFRGKLTLGIVTKAASPWSLSARGVDPARRR